MTPAGYTATLVFSPIYAFVAQRSCATTLNQPRIAS
jgi:hypothetical protein